MIRPKGFVVPDDPEAIKRENALMEERHEKAVVAARREKLKLLLRRYSLAEDDFEGLALALAIEHEPGFQVDRQIAQAPFGFEARCESETASISINHAVAQCSGP